MDGADVFFNYLAGGGFFNRARFTLCALSNGPAKQAFHICSLLSSAQLDSSQ